PSLLLRRHELHRHLLGVRVEEARVLLVHRSIFAPSGVVVEVGKPRSGPAALQRPGELTPILGRPQPKRRVQHLPPPAPARRTTSRTCAARPATVSCVRPP